VNCEGSGDDSCFDPEKNPALKPRDQARPPRLRARQLHQARHPVRASRATRTSHFDVYDTDWDSEAYLTVAGQNSNNSVRAEGRLPARGGNRWRLESQRPHRQEGDEDAEGARAVGEDRLRRLGLGRSRPALPHHHQRLAHLQGLRRHPRVQPVLGIHVPRRHGVQSRLRQPADLLRPRDTRASTSRPTSICAVCGPSCSKSR
jgi:hypothetical protein